MRRPAESLSVLVLVLEAIWFCSISRTIEAGLAWKPTLLSVMPGLIRHPERNALKQNWTPGSSPE